MRPSTCSALHARPGPQGAAPGASPAGNEITFISWNRKVQHILASSSTNGTTVVWDLKRQKPVISFRDPNSTRRASVLQWNPEVATQLVVASDDDRSPTLQMWDLRNSVSPLKEFVGHTKVGWGGGGGGFKFWKGSLEHVCEVGCRRGGRGRGMLEGTSAGGQ